MPEHHFHLSPSATSRWMACPGSLKLSAGMERKSSVYAEEGTKAHALAEQLLLGKQACCEDRAMYDAVMVYVDEINSIRRNMDVIVEHTELTLQCLTIDNLGGTSDHFMLYHDGSRIVAHAIDYKHGQGVPVEAEENLQLLSYFVIIESHYPGWIDEFRGTIVQPRAFQGDCVQTWSCTPERVARHARDILDAVGKEHLKAGDHCRWCPALLKCPEVERQALAVAQSEFDEIKDDTSRLVELMELAPGIKAFLDKIPGAIMAHFRDGREVPGYKVVESRSHRRWAFEDEGSAAQALARLGLPREKFIEEKLRTPAQVEKELPKDKRKELTSMTKQIVIGHKVVPQSHRGRAVDLTSCNEFTEITEDGID